MTNSGADELWDAWERARGEEPELSLEQFARRAELDATEVRELLGILTDLEDETEPPPLVEVRPGDEFAGFELVSVLGRGSSGIVFTARAADGASVALKVLNPLTTVGAAARRTLRREVEVAARLDHPAIVRVLSNGVERGYAWIASELVVDARPVAPGDVPPADAAGVVLQAARALQHAHQLGIVHRDLKPANILLDGEGRARVIDFGLAQLEGAAFAISRTGAPIGTPLYMAPEQLRGQRDVGPPADLYSLGLILLELHAGKPLDLVGGVDSLARIASGDFRFPRRILRRVTPPLREVVARCLEPDPRDRYPDAATLIEDLEAARDGRPLPMGAPTPWERALKAAVRHPVRAGVRVAAAALLLWVGSLAWAWWTTVEVRLYFTGEGVVLSVDGQERDVSSGEPLALRTGSHSYELGWPTFSGNLPLLVGEFTVGRGTVSRDLRGFPEGPTALDPPPGGGPWGFLALATLDHELGPAISLDGEDMGVLAMPVVHLAVGLGEHVLTVDWGDREVEHPFTLTGDHYTAIDVVQPSAPGWRDVVIGSHRDSRVIEIVAENAAPRVWKARPDSKAPLGDEVTHLAYEQVDPSRAGSVTVRVQLPIGARRVEVLHLSNAGVGGLTSNGRGAPRTVVEAGPSIDNLVRIASVGRSEARIDVDQWPELSSRFDGERELVLRYSFPPGRRPERALYAMLPRVLNSGAALWEPAVVLRVSDEPPSASLPEFETPLAIVGPVPVAQDLFPAVHLGGDRFALARWDVGAQDRVYIVEAGVRKHKREVPGVEFGKSLALVGDLDGDEIADLAVGAPGTRTNPGAVFFLSGKDLQNVGDPLVGGEVGDMFGNVLASIGDLDGGGARDLLVASRTYWNGGTGKVWVITLEDRKVWREHVGPHYGAAFGMSVCSVGDADGDGVDDYAVGARDADGPALDSGAVRVFSGRTGALMERIRGPARPSRQLGASLVGGDGGLQALASDELVRWSGGELRRSRIFPATEGIYGSGARRFLVAGGRTHVLERVGTSAGPRWLLGAVEVGGKLQPVFVEVR
jgi:Protein kinase domain/FG-GAP repeat